MEISKPISYQKRTPPQSTVAWKGLSHKRVISKYTQFMLLHMTVRLMPINSSSENMQQRGGRTIHTHLILIGFQQSLATKMHWSSKQWFKSPVSNKRPSLIWYKAHVGLEFYNLKITIIFRVIYCSPKIDISGIRFSNSHWHRHGGEVHWCLMFFWSHWG